MALRRRCTIGPFVLDTGAQLLLLGVDPAPVGRRGAALLQMLVERPGALITKEELVTGAWGDLIVEEGNLATQVAALRRVLATVPGGKAWIETLPRRGYRFVGPADWGVENPEAAPLLAAAAAAVVAASPDDGPPSIAVLPFRALPPDPVPDHVVDGFLDDVVTSLSQLAELVVISSGSTFRMRDAGLDPVQAGRDLGVRYIARGSIRRVAGRMRVRVELVHTGTGAVLTSRQFDEDRARFETAPDEVVAELLRTIAPRVREDELRRIRAKRPGDMDAYDRLLRARELVHLLDPAFFGDAEALLHEAIALEPGYASAYTQLAELCSLRLAQGWSTDRQADTDAVERYARAAVERDPHDARALARYGHSRTLLFRDFELAQTMFARALAANPNEPTAWMWSATTQAWMGNGAAAVRQAEQALRLSPLDWHIMRIHSVLALAHYVNGTFEEAAQWGLAAMATNARDAANVRMTIASLVASGQEERARVLVPDVGVIAPGVTVAQVLARIPFAEAARRERFGALLRQAGLAG